MQLLPVANKIAPAATAGEPSRDSCARDVLNVAPRVVRTIRQLMRDHRLSFLSVPQFRALALLSFSPKVSLSAVADYIGASLPAASRMIDGMVAKKLVVRQACCNDRRQISLALTARGAAAFRASRQATQKQLSQRLKPLSEPQLHAVSQAMQVLSGIFGSDGDGIPLVPINGRPGTTSKHDKAASTK
jgi:DNA-binding MarR family transcriptional regulator